MISCPVCCILYLRFILYHTSIIRQSPALRKCVRAGLCIFLFVCLLVRQPLLAGHPLSLRRATGAVGRCSAKRLPPTCCCDRHGMAATPEGAKISPLAACEKWAAILSRNAPLRASARPDLRQQMPPIFGQTLLYLLPLKGKGVIRKRGETLVSPLFASRSERACEQPPAGRLLASRSAPAARSRTPSRWGRALRFALPGEKTISLWGRRRRIVRAAEQIINRCIVIIRKLNQYSRRNIPFAPLIRAVCLLCAVQQCGNLALLFAFIFT